MTKENEKLGSFKYQNCLSETLNNIESKLTSFGRVIAHNGKAMVRGFQQRILND